MKKATSIDEQIALYRQRGMQVLNEDKAREVLLDIGYYRLGFYCSAFEVDYPHFDRGERRHQYREGAILRNAIDLYYFDCKLRDLLSVALHRVEVNFRTKVCYYGSNKFSDKPTWFVDTACVERGYALSFEDKVYKMSNFKKSKPITAHHRKYPNDRFAPAWKTIEFMSFGQVQLLFEKLRDDELKQHIALTYRITRVKTLNNYVKALVELRNLCTHNSTLFDAQLSQSIGSGPAVGIDNSSKHTIIGAIRVLVYMLSQISENRANELCANLNRLIEAHRQLCPQLSIFTCNLSF